MYFKDTGDLIQDDDFLESKITRQMTVSFT